MSRTFRDYGWYGMRSVNATNQIKNKRDGRFNDTGVKANIKEENRKTRRAQEKVALHNEVVCNKDSVYPTHRIHSSDIWNWD